MTHPSDRMTAKEAPCTVADFADAFNALVDSLREDGVDLATLPVVAKYLNEHNELVSVPLMDHGVLGSDSHGLALLLSTPRSLTDGAVRSSSVTREQIARAIDLSLQRCLSTRLDARDYDKLADAILDLLRSSSQEGRLDRAGYTDTQLIEELGRLVNGNDRVIVWEAQGVVYVEASGDVVGQCRDRFMDPEPFNGLRGALAMSHKGYDEARALLRSVRVASTPSVSSKKGEGT